MLEIIFGQSPQSVTPKLVKVRIGTHREAKPSSFRKGNIIVAYLRQQAFGGTSKS